MRVWAWFADECLEGPDGCSDGDGVTTIHSAQGASVDTAHALASQRTDREALYVAMTRARESNHLDFVSESPEICGPDSSGPDLRDRLVNAITREEDGSGLEVFAVAD